MCNTYLKCIECLLHVIITMLDTTIVNTTMFNTLLISATMFNTYNNNYDNNI